MRNLLLFLCLAACALCQSVNNPPAIALPPNGAAGGVLSGTYPNPAIASGAALGTPISLVLTNATGLPLTTGATGLLPAANAGCGIAFVPALGGMLYSAAGGCAILAPTATAGLPLLSGSTAAPVWATVSGTGTQFPTTAGPTFTGTMLATNSTLSGMLLITPDALSDNGSTIATDASLGNIFQVTALTANVTLSNPTNPVNGQRVEWRILQHASAAKTLAFGAAFQFGTEITACTISAGLSSRSRIIAEYDSTVSKWDIIGCITGY